jgi:hypothetical protein
MHILQFGNDLLAFNLTSKEASRMPRSIEIAATKADSPSVVERLGKWTI